MYSTKKEVKCMSSGQKILRETLYRSILYRSILSKIYLSNLEDVVRDVVI